MWCVNKREEIDTHHFKSMSLLKVYGGESNRVVVMKMMEGSLLVGDGGRGTGSK